jgi:hypothetical protein
MNICFDPHSWNWTILGRFLFDIKNRCIYLFMVNFMCFRDDLLVLFLDSPTLIAFGLFRFRLFLKVNFDRFFLDPVFN